MVDFNPFLADVRSDPYPTYRTLRDEAPVYWSELMQAWLLTAYDDVVTVLKDHGRFSSDRTQANNRFIEAMEAQRQQSTPLSRAATMLSVDPPDHTRMRTLVNKAFTPRVVEMRPHIEEIANALLDAVPEPNRLDVITDLAIPLPIIVIAELLGVSPADRQQFKQWSADIAKTLGGPFQPAEVLERARASSQELSEYFRAAIAERRREPGEDVLSGLIAAEEQGDLLSHDELMATAMLLLVAGNETTTNLIGNGVLALLQHPDQMRRLQDDPSLIVTAVEEMLRYDSPVQLTSRVATGATRIREKGVEPGQVVITALGAANRDPAQFVDPEALDIARQDNRHLAFGQGIHYCVGAPLARLEAQIAINSLLKRLPEPEPDFEEPLWSNSFILRGLVSLPVRSRVAPMPP